MDFEIFHIDDGASWWFRAVSGAEAVGLFVEALKLHGLGAAEIGDSLMDHTIKIISKAQALDVSIIEHGLDGLPDRSNVWEIAVHEGRSVLIGCSEF